MRFLRGMKMENQKNVKNIVVDLQEAVSRCMTGDGNNFWDRISSILKDAKQHLDGDKVKIAFAGKMKAGKSTLVNMILGEDLSATGITPATKTIIEFHCDLDDPRIEFIKNDRIYSKMPLDEEGRIEVQRKMTTATSEFDFIRIYCDDKPILSRFVLVDVPGTADLDRGVEAKIKNYLTKNEVATIIWVSEISTSMPKDECDYIKDLVGLGKNMIFVLNCKSAFTEGDKKKFMENFKRNIPGYEPFIFSVKKEDKPQIVQKNGEDESDFARRKTKLESKYKESSEAQAAFVRYLNRSSKEIKEKNGIAVIKMIPNEFEKVLYDERAMAVSERTEIREKFFDEFIPKFSVFSNSIKSLQGDLNSWWLKKCTNLETQIKNNRYSGNLRENDIITKWRSDLYDDILKKIDIIFDRFVDFDKYDFVDLDFVQTVILLKETRMEFLNRVYINPNLDCLWCGYDKNIAEVSEYMYKDLQQISSSVKFFFTLIIEDCFRRFVAAHNDIWNHYLDRKAELADCMETSGVPFSRKSLFVKDESFETSSDYDAWADETLAIYVNELLSDEKLTNSEKILFKSFYTALNGKKEINTYLKKGSGKALLYPITFRLKAETTEGSELRSIIDEDDSWNDANFESTTDFVDEINRGGHRDFNDFFLYFVARVARVSEIKKGVDINWDFMPENYKN